MADRKPQKAAKKLGGTIKGGAKSVVKTFDFLLGKKKNKKGSK